MKSFKISTYNISSTRLTGKQKVTFCMALYLERITRLYTKQLLPVSLMQFWSAVIWL